MDNNKLVIAEVSECLFSAINYNNSVIEITNLWFEVLSDYDRDESTARIVFAISELLDLSKDKIEKAEEKIRELKNHL